MENLLSRASFFTAFPLFLPSAGVVLKPATCARDRELVSPTRRSRNGVFGDRVERDLTTGVKGLGAEGREIGR